MTFVLSAIWPEEIAMNVLDFSDKMLSNKIVHNYWYWKKEDCILEYISYQCFYSLCYIRICRIKGMMVKLKNRHILKKCWSLVFFEWLHF